jgi:hypothetical protein
MPNIKGSSLAPRFTWVRKHHGDGGVARLLQALSPSTRAIVDGGILKSSWYPFEAWVEINVRIDALFGAGDLALVRELGHFAAVDGLSTVYKLFYKLGSVKWILDQASRLWSVYYDSGRLEITRLPGNEVEFRIVDFATPHATMCLAFLGWCTASVELSGAHVVEMAELRCRARGDAECSFRGRWR